MCIRDRPGTGFSIGDDEFEVYSEFQPMPDEKRLIKSVCSSYKKESDLLGYLTAKEEKDVMICGIMTDFCINATVEAGFEHGLHIIGSKRIRRSLYSIPAERRSAGTKD